MIVGCDLVQAAKEDANLQYGAWLCASLLKSRCHNAKTELLKEKKLFMAFRNNSAIPVTRAKFVFDNAAFIDRSGQNPISTGKSSSQIVIDIIIVIDPSPEVFKQKQDDVQLSKDTSSFIGNNLYDLGYSGYNFIWCDFQENGIMVEERLDHFCAGTKWSLIFPNALISHVDFGMSNHLPILLKCSPHSNEKEVKNRRFMFEHIDTVSAAWTSVLSPNTVENLLSCLKKCAAQLMEWNQSTFGHVRQKICDLEEQLKSQ
ncbi:hypothetical protein Cgig2_021029 [Carnegiea gigantea]|uniref:Uncharacterized protein n=1 Tax=Carnegiea gigantea TaxID=171969 RepID=A0A9Q1GT73_9CARY|nr:hypothetical protein Cgig2_021029 [Carnegiea gigantea]